MSRISRGCLPCRTRRVKCDEGRPSCRRCNLRGDICHGYRDDLSLVFRNENEKAARSSKTVHRRASTQSLAGSGTSSQDSSVSSARREALDAGDPSDPLAAEISNFNLSSSYLWAKKSPQASVSPAEDKAVSQFFEKYVMYPCNNGSSPGFLEYLPGLFAEPNPEGRVALRWAVRAAAYANLSNERDNVPLGNKALQCYGRALSSLGESLADPHIAPDDHILMTVVVLDLFETIFLPDSISRGSHAEGMAQILRLRGPGQIYGARGWSLFRLSHHRLQKQKLARRQEMHPEPAAWLDSLNEEIPYVRIEKEVFQINKTCERARNLIKAIDDTGLPADQILDMLKEIYDLDRIATTWRRGPGWAYKTIHRSQITQDESQASRFPEHVQLHHDVWIAYEWNYHRTGRMIMHEHLLECISRLQTLHSKDNQEGPSPKIPALCSLKQTSLNTIWALVDEVLSTVPQSLGDITHDGTTTTDPSPSGRTPNKIKAVGGYFLLWPMKMIKALRSPTPEQKLVAEAVFEHIRECTGMKAALGELSTTPTVASSTAPKKN